MASSRSLHTVHLAAFGAGNVVGLGVMSMAGIGVGITGTGLWLAWSVAWEARSRWCRSC